ncbi:MAG: hypothetical protein J6Y29_02840 [Clostridiales bacterium]|nr:hypothetical protein [Clostridiales bacterium]
MLIFGTKVYAINQGTPDGTLGACLIWDPAATGETDKTKPNYKFHWVYFGDATGKGYDIAGPILFRVLSTTSNGTLDGYTNACGTTSSGNKKGLFMMSEYGLKYSLWSNRSDFPRQNWRVSSECAVRGELNGTIKSNCFSRESSAIAATTTSYFSSAVEWLRAWDGSRWYYATTFNSTMIDNNENLYDDYLFLLSASEVTSYGFTYQSNYGDYKQKLWAECGRCKLGDSGSSTCSWWLRSACSDGSYNVARVNSSGGSGYNYSYGGDAVRFALNVHLASIITSEASSSGSVASASSTFKAISTTNTGSAVAQVTPTLNATPSSSYKLTIAKSTGFNITAMKVNGESVANGDTISAKKGNKLTLTYSGATATSSAKRNICGVIKNSSNTGTHYFSRAKQNITSATGTVDFYLPSDIGDGTYRMIVYDEDRGADCITSLANYKVMTLIVQSDTPPTITQVYRNNANTGFRVTASDNNALSKIADSSNGNTTYASLSGTSKTVNFTRTSAISSFRVYDNAGLYTSYTVSNATLDQTAPDGGVTYSNGTYTIKARDQGSGLWKVEHNGKIIIDKTGSYPTSSTYQTYTGTGPIAAATVTIYDAVNNTSTLTLDTSEPSVTRAYRKGTNVVIEATDTESGLWKITESVGGAAKVTLSGTSGIAKFTVSSGVTTVYVYDHAGNYKEVDLSSEYTAEPQVSVAYGNGEYTITATAANTGLWKIIDAGGTVLPSTSYNGEASYSDYPTTSQTYRARGPLPTGTVYIYDAVSNITQLDLDNLGPTIRRAYKKGSNALIEATDTDSGLYKITESTDVDAQTNAQLTGTNQSVRFTMSGQTAYVYDQAGNYVIVTE